VQESASLAKILNTVEASEQFEIKTSINKCWNFFSNLSNIGSCIPGCEEVTEIDGTTANFKVKFKVGYLSKTFQMKARFKEISDPTHISFLAEGPDAEVSGDLGMSRTETENLTRIRYQIEIRPLSVIGKTAVTMMGKDLVKKQASEFTACVKSKLEMES
jgi:carbon monoxide dehydrogenase subunit G